jgi:hypothetical protein
LYSLKPKLDVLESELHNHCVLSFTETWLNNDESASDISFKNFQAPFCHCRKHKTGGGVAVYVKDHILAKRRSDLEPDTVECVWLELAIRGQIYLYGTFYRPPNSPVSLWDDIEFSIDQAYNTNISKIIIVGDFNANLLSPNTHADHFLSIVQTYNMFQIIKEPTYFTEYSSSLLDIILVSDQSIVEKSSVGDGFLDQYIRYHCPTYGFLSQPALESQIYGYSVLETMFLIDKI